MSDPKATPMTLEEAVEIDRAAQAEQRLVEWHGSFYPRSNEQIRARAIVDQAVRFVKAYTKFNENYEYGDVKVLERSFKMLRALERGESEVQP